MKVALTIFLLVLSVWSFSQLIESAFKREYLDAACYAVIITGALILSFAIVKE